MLAPTEKKNFPSLAIASAATGICMADGMNVSKFQEIYDFVLGHPIWTHELPGYGPEVYRLLREQFPLMPTREAAEADWKAAANAMTVAYGNEVSVRPGFGERTRSPLETLKEMVPEENIIVVTT